MRAGLIIGGAFMMLLGAILFFTIVLTILGIFFGFIGFIMIIVGLFTSGGESEQKTEVTVTESKQTETESKKTETLAICPQCKSRISADSKFCSECGADLKEEA